MQGFVSVETYLTLECPGGTWVIEDLLPVGGYLNIYGEPKAGKSMIAAELTSAISTPAVDEMLGFPVRKHGLVAYFQLDTPRAIWQMRFRNLKKKGYRFDHVYMCDKHLVGKTKFDIQLEGVKWLHEALCELPEFPLVVVIDTLRKTHNGDENSSSVMKDVIEKMEEAARPAAIILISHAKKRQGMEEESSLNNDSRGSSYVPGEMDANMKVDHGSFVFASRTAAEARYQSHKNAVDGEVTITDPLIKEARKLIREHPEPDADLLELGGVLQARVKAGTGRTREEEVCVGTLSRMRTIEIELKAAREAQDAALGLPAEE